MTGFVYDLLFSLPLGVLLLLLRIEVFGVNSGIQEQVLFGLVIGFGILVSAIKAADKRIKIAAILTFFAAGIRVFFYFYKREGGWNILLEILFALICVLISFVTGLLVRLICKNTYKKRLDIMSRIYHDDDEDDYSF